MHAELPAQAEVLWHMHGRTMQDIVYRVHVYMSIFYNFLYMLKWKFRKDSAHRT